MANIGWAVTELNKGNKVRRLQWNDPNKWIKLQETDPKMTMPYTWVNLGGERDDKVPWLPNHEDLLAQDWDQA